MLRQESKIKMSNEENESQLHGAPARTQMEIRINTEIHHTLYITTFVIQTLYIIPFTKNN